MIKIADFLSYYEPMWLYDLIENPPPVKEMVRLRMDFCHFIEELEICLMSNEEIDNIIDIKIQFDLWKEMIKLVENQVLIDNFLYLI